MCSLLNHPTPVIKGALMHMYFRNDLGVRLFKQVC